MPALRLRGRVKLSGLAPKRASASRRLCPCETNTYGMQFQITTRGSKAGKSPAIRTHYEKSRSLHTTGAAMIQMKMRYTTHWEEIFTHMLMRPFSGFDDGEPFLRRKPPPRLHQAPRQERKTNSKAGRDANTGSRTPSTQTLPRKRFVVHTRTPPACPSWTRAWPCTSWRGT